MSQFAVQSVDVEPGNPHMFWSASEDGTVRQTDLRRYANTYGLLILLSDEAQYSIVQIQAETQCSRIDSPCCSYSLHFGFKHVTI